MASIERIKQPLRPRVGLYSAGLKAYWSQFEGLHDRLIGYGKFIEEKLRPIADVANFGLVDDEVSARAAGEWLNAQNVDIVLCHSATYFTSASALPVHQICKAPLVILNLQPTPQMNYDKTSTGEWLAHCVGCPVPELCNALNRAGIAYRTVTGLLGLPQTPAISATDEATAQRPEAKRAWAQIEDWVRAAGVKRNLQHARFGYLGNNYSGMLDMYSDFAMLQAQTGIHVELLEMCDLDSRLRKVTDAEVANKREQITAFFRITGDSPSDPIARKPSAEQLDWSAKIAAAQEKMVLDYNLDALSYYYHGADGNAYEEIQSGFIVGHSLLTAAGIPCAGEGDIKTALAMKVCDILDTGGSFCEIVANDYEVGSVILGHDGPFHVKISDGKPVLRGMGVYHGKRGSGVSVEANVVSGDVTMLGMTQVYGGTLRLIISEGEAVSEKALMIGNTQTHIRFKQDPDAYMDEWFRHAPTHHLAMSVGKNQYLFEKVANIMGIESVSI